MIVVNTTRRILKEYAGDMFVAARFGHHFADRSPKFCLLQGSESKAASKDDDNHNHNHV